MLNATPWSNSEEGPVQPRRYICPSCGGGLPGEAFQAGQRLARCRQCGQLVRRAVRRSWPGAETGSYDWGGPVSYEASDDSRLEITATYPYPALQCPYCEHVNQDTRGPLPQQYCGNCGADLKKGCLSCEAPLYVLDYFCTRCRSDQEKLKYEIEGFYWQHYNEGKRLAQIGRWYEANQELSLFFDPQPDLDREHVRRARQIYVSAIAPYDNGEGLQLYNESLGHLHQAELEAQRALERQKQQRWIAGGVVLVLLGLLSTLTFGSWWAIFIIVPVACLILAAIVLALLGGLGLS